MVQFSDLPSEVVTHIFRSIPLSDLYFSIDKYAPIINPYVCVITDSLNSKFTKLFKNIIQFRDFDAEFDKLTEISFVILHIVNIEETLIIRKELSFVYKILKERNKDTIFILEDLCECSTGNISYQNYWTNEELIILSFSSLFKTYPHSNLLVIKNIFDCQRLPWTLNSFIWDVYIEDIEGVDISNETVKDFKYLFRNLIIEDLGCLKFKSINPSSESNEFSHLGPLASTDLIEETVIFTGIKKAIINFQEPYEKKKHGRVFDIMNFNAGSIEELEVFDGQQFNNGNHIYPNEVYNDISFDLVSNFSPRLFERITKLHITFQYETILNNLSFPNLQSFEVSYYKGDLKQVCDSPLTVNDLYLPKLQDLKFVFSFFEKLAISIINGYILQFGSYHSFEKVEPYQTTKRIQDDNVCHFFRSVLDFELSKKIRRFELQTPSLEIFNRMTNEKSDFTFDSLEELSIICFIYSKTDRFLNQSISDALTHKKQYLRLKKLEIDIIGGGDPIQITTLNSDNIPSLEDLCIKASWESFNSIRGLQVIFLPFLSFINLSVLKLEDLVLPNFRDLNLPNMKEIYLKDVYEDEVFSGLSIIGELKNLKSIDLQYTARKTILKEKISYEFQLEMDRTTTIYLGRWVKILPVITMEKTVYDRLSDLKYSKEAVIFNLV